MAVLWGPPNSAPSLLKGWEHGTGVGNRHSSPSHSGWGRDLVSWRVSSAPVLRGSCRWGWVVEGLPGKMLFMAGGE